MGVVLNWSVVHSRRSEGERKTENYVKKDCRERVKQSGVEELSHATEGLLRQCGGFMRLLARQDMMMMMMMMMMISIIITFQFICQCQT